MANQLQGLGLYIHIPFCESKCNYCDFLSFLPDDIASDIVDQYIEALLLEIESYRDLGGKYNIKTIYIGGGTPSLIDGKHIIDLMNTVRSIFNVNLDGEISIEINPGTVDREKLALYKEAGINRLSIGLQSTNEEELQLLGRIHTYEDFKRNFLLAREIGFNNISVDLISSLPMQTLESWMQTLERVLSLEPEHISAYSLIIEESTPFYDSYGEDNPEGQKLLPNEDIDRRIYEVTKEMLFKRGYHRYEISNYAKPSYESKHNTSYWIGTEYLGLGLGASSYMNECRVRNIDDIDIYINRINNNIFANGSDRFDIIEYIDELSIEERIEEFMFLGLRMTAGISCSEFENKFSTVVEGIYGEIIKKFIKHNVLVKEGDRIYFTDYGLDISNSALAEFLIS